MQNETPTPDSEKEINAVPTVSDEELPKLESNTSDQFTARRYEAYKITPDDDFEEDPTDMFHRGEIISEEGNVFMGLNKDGYGVLRRKNGIANQIEEHEVDMNSLRQQVILNRLSEIQEGEKQLSPHESAHHEPPAVIETVAVEIPQKPKEENSKQGIPGINKVLGWITEAENGKQVNIPEHVLRAHSENPTVAKYLEKQSATRVEPPVIDDEKLAQAAFSEKSAEILETVKKAIANGDGDTVPEEMLSAFKNDPDIKKFLSSRERGSTATPPLHEESEASQIVGQTWREHVLDMIKQGKGEEVSFHALKRFKSEPVVQEYILNRILGSIEDNNIEFLESIEDWNWKLAAVSTHPIVMSYLAERLRTVTTSKDVEKEPRPTAITQLKEKYAAIPVPPVEEIAEIAPTQPEIKKDLSWNQEVVDSLRLEPKEEKVSDAPSSSHDPMNRYWDANIPSLVAEKEREGKLNFALSPKEEESVDPILQPASTEEIASSAPLSEEVAQAEAVEKVISPTLNEVAPLIATRFAEAFRINHEQLEEIEGFAKLSQGKQLLILKNMQSEVLLDVTRGAEKEQKEEWQGRSLWGKIWRSALTMGSYEFARTKAMEKEILARSQGVNPADFKQIESLTAHIANIEEYVKVMETLPEVEVKDNEVLEIQYVSAKSLFGSVESKRLTSENLKTIEVFNAAASKFAMIPHEWGYEPTDEKARREHREFYQGKAEYGAAREKLLSVLSENAVLSGEENPERSASLTMNRIDEQMELNQLFSAHPRVEEVLGKIQNQNAVLSGVNEFMRDKGFYVALGAATRIGIGSVLGALSGGLGALLATGIGAGVGKITGESEARKIIRNRRIDRRLSEEDEREEITYNTGVESTPQVRKIREFIDAAFFVDRIDRLTDKLHEAQTPEERALLESKIAKTTAIMEEKFDQGLINFGGSSLEVGDVRKGNIIANKLSFIQALGRGAAVEVIDGEKLKAEVEQMVSSHQEKIEQVRAEEVVKAGKRAAYIRGAFALGGALIVEGVHQGGLTDRIFEHSTGAKEAVISNVEIPFHTYTSDEIAHVREVILAHKVSGLPQEAIDSNNQAYAKGVEEYMKSTDEHIRHLTAETLGKTDAQMDAEIARLIKESSITSHATPHTVVAPIAQSQEFHIPQPTKEMPPLEKGVHIPQPVTEQAASVSPQTPPQAPTPLPEAVYTDRHLPSAEDAVNTTPSTPEAPSKWEPVEYVERHLPPPPDINE